MYRDKAVCVVVPAHNEERLIGRVLSTMPAYVDHVVVVDDGSTDGTVAIVREQVEGGKGRVVLLELAQNRGVGAAIAAGYVWARERKVDLTAVMAGDAQMAPEDLDGLLDEAIDGDVDYVKGNRLFSGEAWKIIPRTRYLGNSVLSLLTKIVSGYWHVADSQTGFTVIGLRALRLIEVEKIYPGFGVPNDILVRLNVFECKVRDVPIRPVYDVGEVSELKIGRAVFTISILLVRLFFWRLFQKYVLRDFHPLVFFYAAGGLMLPLGGGFGLYLTLLRLSGQGVAATSALLAVLLFVSGLQLLLFAMWFDMERNKHLR